LHQYFLMMDLDNSKLRRRSTALFNYSYVVLAITLLLTTGATVAYHRNVELGSGWTPGVFLAGLCISLLLFGMTHREAAARARLLQKTLDLLAARKENRALLDAEQRSRIAAEKASRAKDEFLAVISHELKTPLNAIAGWTRILRTRGISEEAHGTALDKIEKNLRIQTSIVEELLSFSDVMSTEPPSRKHAVRIGRVLEDAIADVRAEAAKKGVTLAAESHLNGARVEGDRERLRMAIVNVIANAVKFTPRGGSVNVTGTTLDHEVRCVVSDDGPGISDDFLPHIFEQYKQFDRGTTRHFGGLGLGLTIARHIVRQHNGEISAESSGPGSGSTFTIVLPLRSP
jgi:signal transduction histidine kinase